jgi:tRNA pseudouridine(55) synthase
MSEAGQGRAGQPFGILLIDKPAGPTSHDVVAWVRWALRERSVGHCGTLDPAATGLLVVCVGAATKLVEHLTAVDKRYLARFVLGRSTTTADAEGEVEAVAEVPADALERAELALAGMVGPLELAPPAYSAVKIEGKRAHELARAGEAPQLAARPMVVERLHVEGRGRAEALAWLDVDLSVTKGTYVRSLAEELGRRLDLPAHLGALRRLACGDLSLEDPVAVTGIEATPLEGQPGRPRRWRIGFDGVETRERAGALLRARLVPPWKHLPFSATELHGSEHEPWIARLVQGQRLRVDPATSAILGLGSVAEGHLHTLVDRASGRMILVRCEADAEGSRRVAPVRLLRFDPSH